ncbi:MAG: chromosome partitioning protein ParA [Candidatus Rokuibacteriota bacterium]|nr:MAG: chromosome partitioning protein ParA [Candidatus Rokubacteria bacterium]PYN27516.1 MAG: chromosome partitioning protein ParA [Candidatus Rokubacteria bacterium]
MRTIAVVNQKGGCGKTITSINLSAFLAREQRRVLLVDMDPQGHATLGLLTDAAQPSRTMYEVFLPDAGRPPTGLGDVIRPVRENLDVAPSDILLSAIPETLAGRVGREDILSEAMASVEGRYDYVIVDCPPNVGLLTFNTLKACSEAIVPMDPSFFSLHGLGKLLETIEVLAKETDHHIAVRALVTLYSGRSAFAKAVLDEIRRHLDGRHFETVIRYSVKLAEAASHGVPIAHYSRDCVGFDDYRALAVEVLQQEAAMRQRERVTIKRNATGASARDDGAGSSVPAVTPEGVMFTIEAPDAERVQLAGDFNNWTLDGNDMEAMDGVWKKVVKLPPGRYRYRYVVDGRWQNDPLNTTVEPSPYGGEDSVLVMDERVATAG